MAIGDFILAMGFRNDNGVMDAKRILITSPLERTTRRAVMGSLSDLQKTQVTLEALVGGEKLTFSNSKDLTIFAENDGEVEEINFNELKEGQRAVVVGETDAGKFVARSLRVLPQ